jgi:hypothetical protein
MVGMLVSEQHSMHDPDLFAQQLVPHIRRSVDQQVSTGQTQDCTATGAAITWIQALADVAAAANGRHSHACTRAQQDKLSANLGGEKFSGHVQDRESGGEVVSQNSLDSRLSAVDYQAQLRLTMYVNRNKLFGRAMLGRF